MIDHIYYLEEIELFQFLIVIDDEDEEFIWFGDGTLLVITVNEKQNSRWNIWEAKLKMKYTPILLKTSGKER